MYVCMCVLWGGGGGGVFTEYIHVAICSHYEQDFDEL